MKSASASRPGHVLDQATEAELTDGGAPACLIVGEVPDGMAQEDLMSGQRSRIGPALGPRQLSRLSWSLP